MRASIIASGEVSLRTRPSTRWTMNGSTMAMSPRPARSDTARAHACMVSAVAGSFGVDPEQHLAAVEPHPRYRRGVVSGEPVVHLEDGLGQAAPVHRADDDLALERAEQQQVLQHVGGAEHAADAGPAERHAEPLEQVGAVGHGEPLTAGPQGAAGRVVGRDDDQAAVRADDGRGAGPGRRRLGYLPRAAAPGSR